jgi:hypothetical protein
MADAVGAIDWTAPWFEPWRGDGEPVTARHQAGEPLVASLNAQRGAPVRFVGQSALPAGEAYERYIFHTRECPTRENAHDFFNALVWLRFPVAKRRINELQAGEIDRQGVGPARGRVRDALTVFDENGALLEAPPPLWEALAARDWHRLFVGLRPLWGQARLLVFGHALLEKLLQPRKPLTAHVWNTPCRMDSPAQLDAWLAGQFTADRVAAKPFLPLPLLGIPGWCAENQNFSFYDDSVVFRSAAIREPERRLSGGGTGP